MEQVDRFDWAAEGLVAGAKNYSIFHKEEEEFFCAVTIARLFLLLLFCVSVIYRSESECRNRHRNKKKKNRNTTQMLPGKTEPSLGGAAALHSQQVGTVAGRRRQTTAMFIFLRINMVFFGL